MAAAATAECGTLSCCSTNSLEHQYVDKLQLHQGRHSTVWSSTCTATGDTVVIKGYSKVDLKPRQLLNVQREISLLRLLGDYGYKGVVKLKSTFEDAQIIYLVFEACLKGDLYQLLHRNKGSLPEEYVTKEILAPLLSVLSQLHQLGIVHRDIKPENIFVDEHGHMLLGDFGLAAHVEHDSLMERLGTLDYMAPEVLSMPTPDEAANGRGKSMQPYNEKVDVWAVGVLAYELLTGHPPFEVENPKQTAQLILNAKLPEMPRHLSEHALDFLQKTLTKKPNQRPSAEELRQHPWLEQHTAHLPPSFHVATPPRTLQQHLTRTWTSGPFGSIHVHSGSLDDGNGDESSRASKASKRSLTYCEGQPQEDHIKDGEAPAAGEDQTMLPGQLSAPEQYSPQPRNFKATLSSSCSVFSSNLSAALHLAASGTRRASSGTSEYLGFTTPPTKPSSPEASFIMAATSGCLTAPSTPTRPVDHGPQTSSSPSEIASAMASVSVAGPAEADEQGQNSNDPQAWQARSPQATKRTPGKSRFCR